MYNDSNSVRKRSPLRADHTIILPRKFLMVYSGQVIIIQALPCMAALVFCLCKLAQGVKLTFFPGSHLAPKYFKVVANSKKLVAMTNTHNHFYLIAVPFSSPEAAIHLASAMDRDLWPAPIFSPRFTDFRSFCAVSYFYQNGGPGNKFWTRNSKFQRHHIKRKTI